MLKATASTEGGRRFLYLEASNEGVDQQAEVVAAKALADRRSPSHSGDFKTAVFHLSTPVSATF